MASPRMASFASLHHLDAGSPRQAVVQRQAAGLHTGVAAEKAFILRNSLRVRSALPAARPAAAAGRLPILICCHVGDLWVHVQEVHKRESIMRLYPIMMRSAQASIVLGTFVGAVPRLSQFCMHHIVA